jgi:hypothetical protein
MPRSARRRPPPCDCVDCDADARPTPAPGSHAALARQDPPPKSVVVAIFGAVVPLPRGEGNAGDAEGDADGADARTSLDAAACPHLDRAAADGCAGLLAFAPGPPRGAQLLGAPAAGGAWPPAESLEARFPGLCAALLTDDAALAAGAAAAGYTADGAGAPLPRGGAGRWPKPAAVAARLAAALGAPTAPAPRATPASVLAALGGEEEGDAGEEDEDGADAAFLVLHADAATADVAAEPDSRGEKGAEEEAAALAAAVAALEWADALVRALDAAPGLRGRTLLTLVLGAGPAPLPGAGRPALGGALLAPAGADFPPVRRPRQSAEFSGVAAVAPDARRPAVVVHRLPGVVRRDGVARLTLGEVRARGGGGAILAERVLPELAYKLGRAPKYGA